MCHFSHRAAGMSELNGGTHSSPAAWCRLGCPWGSSSDPWGTRGWAWAWRSDGTNPPGHSVSTRNKAALHGTYSAFKGWCYATIMPSQGVWEHQPFYVFWWHHKWGGVPTKSYVGYISNICYSPLSSLVDWSIQHTCRWTLLSTYPLITLLPGGTIG